MADLSELHAVIESAGDALRERLISLKDTGGFTRERYVRVLQMQYHLTKEVQRYFMSAAAHPCMAGKRAFRDFLYSFALEEEPHYGIAENDLRALGADVGQPPLDVKLWHAYFQTVVLTDPYQRLGAASVLESIGSHASDVIKELLADADYLNEGNTRFVVIHMHETLPHGTQFLLEVTNSDPSESETASLVAGARDGAIMYMRMADWALGLEPALAPKGQEIETY